MVDAEIFIPERHRHTLLFVTIALAVLVIGGAFTQHVDTSKLISDIKGPPGGDVHRTVSAQQVQKGDTFIVRLETDTKHSTLKMSEQLPPGFSIVDGSTRFSREAGFYILEIYPNDNGVNYIVRVDEYARSGVYEIKGTYTNNESSVFSTGKTVMRVV